MSENNNFILLRGLSRESRHWWNFEDYLKSNIQNSVVHYLEYPGSGKRYKEIFPLDTNALLEDINNQVEKIKSNNSGKYFFVSISLGGMVAMNYLSKFPGVFEKIFLINTSSKDIAKFYERFRFGIWLSAIKVLFSGDYFSKEYKILDFTTNLLDSSSREHIASVYAQYANENRLSYKNLFRQLFWAAKNQSPKSLKDDVVFISSFNDRLCYHECGSRLSKKFDKAFLLHDKAGHDLPLDDAQWLSLKIKESL